MSEELSQVQQQRDELKAQNQRFQADLETERCARLEESTVAILVKYVRQPAELLAALNNAGVLVEEQGELVLQTDQGAVSIEQGLPALLQAAEYQQFRHEGTATDLTQDLDLKHYKGGKAPDPDQLLSLLQDPQTRTEVMQETQRVTRRSQP